MKRLTLFIVFLFFALLSQAQVIFRNDFVIGKHQKIKNKGLTFITISLERNPYVNTLLNGRGGRTLVIDVKALRHPEKTYTYSELAERIYVPALSLRPVGEPVPRYLLMEPPVITPWTFGQHGKVTAPHSLFSREL